MSDKDDPNLTSMPTPAVRRPSTPTQTMQAIQDTGQTRFMAAIQATHERREDAKATVDPAKLFWFGVIRNFVLGVPFSGMGFIFFYKALSQLSKHLGTEAFAFHDLIPFTPPALLLLVGVAFIAPGPTETALRFIGAGNILDKLPFVKKAGPS